MQRTKYFVAYLLEGGARHYHLSLTKELSDRFYIAPLHERVDPHITIKNFEANNYEIAGVESVLERLARAAEPVPLTIEGFGRFGYKTLFLDVQKSRQATLFARECINELNQLSWIRSLPHEGEKLHASVARFLQAKQSKRIWRLLSKKETPHFKMHLNTITVLKKPGRRWQVHREFVLGGRVSTPSGILSEGCISLQA